MDPLFTMQYEIRPRNPDALFRAKRYDCITGAEKSSNRVQEDESAACTISRAVSYRSALWRASTRCSRSTLFCGSVR